ncbi:protein of unknown function DUF1977 [Theobroma cacao]|nr:protein of unknown function DUF1977 [Theobroma cacao]
MPLVTSRFLSFSICVLIQSLLGLLILILLSNFLPSSEPLYSLSRSYPYEYKMKTLKGVSYYVESTKFEQKYPANNPDRVRFEERVERDYVSVLRQNCRIESQLQPRDLIPGTPHCDLLHKFTAA